LGVPLLAISAGAGMFGKQMLYQLSYSRRVRGHHGQSGIYTGEP
jgi:hypothetical protein